MPSGNRSDHLLTRRPFWYRKEFFLTALPALLFLVTLICGTIGYYKYFESRESDYITGAQLYYGDSLWDEAILNTLPLALAESTQVDGRDVPWQLQVARVTGFFTAATTLLGIFLTWMAPRVERLRPRLFGRGRFSVVCGLGWKGHELALDYLKQTRPNAVEYLGNRRYRDATRAASWSLEPKAATTPEHLRDQALRRRQKTIAEFRTPLRGDRAEDATSRFIIKGICLGVKRIGKFAADLILFYPRLFCCNRLIVIDEDKDNHLRQDMVLPWVVHFIDDATLEQTLKDARIADSNMLHIVTDNDEINCRISLQAVDVLKQHYGPFLRPSEAGASEIPYDEWDETGLRCFAHIHDLRLRAYIEDHCKLSWLNLSAFSVYDNAVRGVLAEHPLVRFENGEAKWPKHIVVFGSSRMSDALCDAIFHQAHFFRDYDSLTKTPARPELHLTLIHDSPMGQTEFEDRFPFLSYGSISSSLSKAEIHSDGLNGKALQAVVDYTFPWTIEHYILPKSDMELLDPEGPLKKCHMFSTAIFYALDDGIRSGALRKKVDPMLRNLRVRWLSDPELAEKHDLPFFSTYRYCNLPEEEIGEKRNSDGLEADTATCREKDYIPGYVFGQLSACCSRWAIAEHALEELAQHFSARYAARNLISRLRAEIGSQSPDEFEIGKLKSEMRLYEENPVKYRKRNWYLSDSSWERESNRQAAKHAITKIRLCNLDLRLNQQKNWVIPEGLVSFVGNIERPETVKMEMLINQLTELEHRRWCAERLVLGWQPLSDEKDILAWKDNRLKSYLKDRKFNYDLVPFAQLGDEGHNTKELDKAQIHDLQDWLLKERQTT